MRKVKTTHRTKGKAYGVTRKYNRPGTSKNKMQSNATHGKGSKRHG